MHQLPLKGGRHEDLPLRMVRSRADTCRGGPGCTRLCRAWPTLRSFFARALNAAGFLVHTVDHRGHGRTADGRFGDFGAAGFNGPVDDVAQFGSALRSQHGTLPLFLFADSMGSFATQAAILNHSDHWQGVVLAGSSALDRLAVLGASPPADAPKGLRGYNAGLFHRTGYEWLSRDPAEVDAYVADPWCGWEPVHASARSSMFALTPRLADPGALAGIRPDLPLLIASGDADPLAGGGPLIDLLGQRYRQAGLRDVTVRLYPDARHELLKDQPRRRDGRHRHVAHFPMRPAPAVKRRACGWLRL